MEHYDLQIPMVELISFNAIYFYCDKFESYKWYYYVSGQMIFVIISL
jgi:hypothetical protein